MAHIITPTVSASPQAFFIDGSAGRLFAIHLPPAVGRGNGESVLIVPPFAEEMMLVRRMVSLQARRLSEIGIGTLILDLYGTGDSAGDFQDARWSTWLSDLGSGVDWLSRQEYSEVHLLGVRLGAILALDFQHRSELPLTSKSVFWQPVTSGNENLREFLLLRVLAGMMQKAIPRVSLSGLQEKLAVGDGVEVAGYRLSADLWSDIDGLTLADLGKAGGSPIQCLELGNADDTTPSSAIVAAIREWDSRGVDASLRHLNGFPFWAEWGVRVVSELLDATTEAFGVDNTDGH